MWRNYLFISTLLREKAISDTAKVLPVIPIQLHVGVANSVQIHTHKLKGSNFFSSKFCTTIVLDCQMVKGPVNGIHLPSYLSLSTGLISLLNETKLNEHALLKHFIPPTHLFFSFFLPNNLSNLRESTPWAYSAKVKCQHLSLFCRAHSSATVSMHSHLRLEWDCLQIPLSNSEMGNWWKGEWKKVAYLSFLWFFFF